MTKIQYVKLDRTKLTSEEWELIKMMCDLIAYVEDEKFCILGRYDTNKKALRKLLKNG